MPDDEKQIATYPSEPWRLVAPEDMRQERGVSRIEPVLEALPPNAENGHCQACDRLVGGNGNAWRSVPMALCTVEWEGVRCPFFRSAQGYDATVDAPVTVPDSFSAMVMPPDPQQEYEGARTSARAAWWQSNLKWYKDRGVRMDSTASVPMFPGRKS